MSLFDEEEQMLRAEHARARVANHDDPVASPHLREAWNPEAHRNALRTLQLHGTPALHDWLLDLENQVIDLLKPEGQERLRRSQ